MATVNDAYVGNRRSLMWNVLKIVRDPTIAEDLAQEAYLRTRRAADTGPIEHLEAFLQTTARNLALDHLRRRRRREKVEFVPTNNQLLENVAEDSPSAEESMIEQDRIRQFERAMESLPDRARTILVLNQLEGWSQPKIAEHLGISPRTVWSDLKMAMAHCRDVIDKLSS